MLEFVHEVAAAVWLGGLITLGALVPALRRAGVERPQLQAMARQFGRGSWSAMVILVVSSQGGPRRARGGSGPRPSIHGASNNTCGKGGSPGSDAPGQPGDLCSSHGALGIR